MSGIPDSGKPLGVSADPTNAMLAQFLQLLQRRKVLWEFKLGVVNTASAGNSDVYVLLDGDDVPIVCRTLIGPPRLGAKVAVIFVPPTGYYVIGVVGGQPIGALGLVGGALVTTIGGLNTAASAETDVPNLQFSAAVSLNRLYEFRLMLVMNATVGTDLANILVRRDTALTGTQLFAGNVGGGTTSPFFSGMWPFEPTASETLTFFTSHARLAGTGTFRAFGAPNTGINRTWAGLFDVGPAGFLLHT